MNNTQGKRNDNDSKKIVTMLALVFTLMFCTTGATYAYLAFTASNNVATGTVAAAGLTLTVATTEEGSSTDFLRTPNTGVMVPQEEGALVYAMNNDYKCVDDYGNIVCKVYRITVSTTSTATIPTTGAIEFTNPSTNLKWKLVRSASSASSPTPVNSDQILNTESNFADNIPRVFADHIFTSSLKKFTYYMVIWVNETGSIQNDSGSWKATISFHSSNGTGITSTITNDPEPGEPR